MYRMNQSTKISFFTSIRNSIVHAWNAFRRKDPYTNDNLYGSFSTFKPDRHRLGYFNEKTLIGSIYNRIAIDVAAINVYHVRVNQNGSYEEMIDSDLNDCLTRETNKDQSARQFIQDVVLSLFDEGCIAIVPTEAEASVSTNNILNIKAMRCGKILEWYPDYVKINLYNDKTGLMEDTILPKNQVAIVENPFYTVMNEPNSTVSRLNHKLNLMDIADENAYNGKIDLIIQYPYLIKNESKKKLADDRRAELERQLNGANHGIAWTDASEKVIQLNRAVENQLLEQIKFLQDTLYNQLGLTQAVFDGTADEQVMLNYYNRTVEPVLGAITEAMQRVFLTKTAYSKGERILYIRNPFKLVPVNNLADIADKFTRNEILSSNEVRAIIGYRPSDDPRADELRNKNIAASKDQLPKDGPTKREEVNDNK